MVPSVTDDFLKELMYAVLESVPNIDDSGDYEVESFLYEYLR